MNYQIRIFLFF